MPVQHSLLMNSEVWVGAFNKEMVLIGPSLNIIVKTCDTRLDPLELCRMWVRWLAEISPLSFCDFYVTWFGRKCGKVGTARPGACTRRNLFRNMQTLLWNFSEHSAAALRSRTRARTWPCSCAGPRAAASRPKLEPARPRWPPWIQINVKWWHWIFVIYDLYLSQSLWCSAQLSSAVN